MGATVKAKNRAVRREELSRFISEQGKLQYVFDNIKKFEDLKTELDPVELRRLEAATNSRIKLLDFYMPKLKAVELTGEDGESIKIEGKVEWSIQPVKAINEA
jgi:hypothetical protein